MEPHGLKPVVPGLPRLALRNRISDFKGKVPEISQREISRDKIWRNSLRQFRHTRRGYPPTCRFGGIRRSATAFCRVHPRLKKPWYSAKADKAHLGVGIRLRDLKIAQGVLKIAIDLLVAKWKRTEIFFFKPDHNRSIRALSFKDFKNGSLFCFSRYSLPVMLIQFISRSMDFCIRAIIFCSSTVS